MSIGNRLGTVCEDRRAPTPLRSRLGNGHPAVLLNKACLHEIGGLAGGFRMGKFAGLVTHPFQLGWLRTQPSHLFEEASAVHLTIQDQLRSPSFSECFGIAKLM